MDGMTNAPWTTQIGIKAVVKPITVTETTTEPQDQTGKPDQTETQDQTGKTDQNERYYVVKISLYKLWIFLNCITPTFPTKL